MAGAGINISDTARDIHLAKLKTRQNLTLLSAQAQDMPDVESRAGRERVELRQAQDQWQRQRASKPRPASVDALWDAMGDAAGLRWRCWRSAPAAPSKPSAISGWPKPTCRPCWRASTESAPAATIKISNISHKSTQFFNGVALTAVAAASVSRPARAGPD